MCSFKPQIVHQKSPLPKSQTNVQTSRNGSALSFKNFPLWINQTLEWKPFFQESNSVSPNSLSSNSLSPNILPEPEALQGPDYDTQASEELPELANMAVVAIHNLATVPPAAAYSSSLSPYSKLKRDYEELLYVGRYTRVVSN